eukprot:747077-Hanusia_phi.AAC.1
MDHLQARQACQLKSVPHRLRHAHGCSSSARAHASRAVQEHITAFQLACSSRRDDHPVARVLSHHSRLQRQSAPSIRAGHSPPASHDLAVADHGPCGGPDAHTGIHAVRDFAPVRLHGPSQQEDAAASALVGHQLAAKTQHFSPW